MTVLLRIDASARSERSITRRLADAFVCAWREIDPTTHVLTRDVGIEPPPMVSQAWIAAAFTPSEQRSPEMMQVLRSSDEMIEELRQADVLLVGAPLYNYGMPASLKAWVDQVVRVGETFSFDLSRGDFPIQSTLRSKTMVLLTSRGEFG
jgi:FMN-dependent NADH-azoreductase